MRVTENTNFNIVKESISRAKGRMEDLQHQAATMKKLNQPSDDPIGASKVLEMRTEKVNNDQFISNARQAENMLNNSDQVLSELEEIAVRARELAVRQASGASSTSDSRLGVAEEVTQLYEQAIAAGNRKIGDRFLFGGFQMHRPPVDEQGNYHGDMGEAMSEISKGVYVATNVPGIDIFNTDLKGSSDYRTLIGQQGQEEGDRSPAQAELSSPQSRNVNVFSELKKLRIGLLTGELDTIRETLDGFDSLIGHLNSTRAKVGSRLSGIQNAMTALERHNIVNAKLTSSIEDADMAEVMSDLAKEETVLRNTMASGKKLIQPTLMDFLK